MELPGHTTEECLLNLLGTRLIVDRKRKGRNFAGKLENTGKGHDRRQHCKKYHSVFISTGNWRSALQLYSFVDSVVVGRGIGAQALAAVGATSIVVWLTLGFAMGITKGFCIHISQAYGKKDYHLVNRGFFVASVLSLIVGTMISIVGSLAIRDFLILMHTPGEILEQSLDYIKVILLGFVITVLNNLFMSVLQSLGDSSTPFCALLVSSITNVGLDCVFVLILKWGVQGAAVATVLSQVFSFAICAAGLKRLEFVSLLDGCKSKMHGWQSECLKTGMPVEL